MKTRIKNYERVKRYRFNKLLFKLKQSQETCGVCYSQRARTYHHKNEDQNDNREINLLPICRECHLNIKHTSDSVTYLSASTEKRTTAPRLNFNAPERPSPRLKNERIVTLLHKPNSNIRIRAIISLRTLNLLEGLGYTQT